MDQICKQRNENHGIDDNLQVLMDVIDNRHRSSYSIHTV